MTLLMFLLDEDLVVIAADTLATDPEGTALFYDHKIHDLGAGICAVATGTANVLFEWMASPGRGTSLSSIEETAPGMLSAIARRLGQGVRSTVYVFGRDAPEGPYSGLVFRSEDRFKAERLRYGFHAKPKVPAVLGTTIPEGPAEWVDLAQRFKAHEDAKPLGQAVPIGGELDLAILTNGEVRAGTIYRFP